MFYLQKVVALVEAEECRGELELLGRTLQAQGVIFYNITGESAVRVWERSVGVQGKLPGDLPGVCGSICSKGLKSECESTKEKEDIVERLTGDEERRYPETESNVVEQGDVPCLWLTDRGNWAGFLADRGQAVLVYLHENNRNRDFSKLRYACESPSELDAEYLDRIYRRYQALPWDILETERCCIRETTEADVPAFYKIYEEPSITRYMENLFPEVEQELQYVKDYREKVYDFYGFGVWTILKKDTGEVIGRAGLSYREGFEEPELGFIIGVPWQRQGYAEEASRAVLEYGREELGFETVQALVMPENIASAALCEKLGFYKEEQTELEGIVYDRFVWKS